MSRMRSVLLNILTSLTITLAGCGGGSDTPPPPPSGPTITNFVADRSAYWVGEQAQLTVAFSNGTGRLEPDGIAVTSGQTITTPMLSVPIRYQLIVTDGTTSVTRSLDLAVSYRDRLRQIAMPFARGEHQAVRLPDDRVLIIGGEDNSNAFPSSVYAFNPGTETFTPFAELATGRVGFVALALYDGDVLVVGGSRALTGAPDAELINHATGAVAATHGAPQRIRHDAAATLLMDGRVFICGGRAPTAPETTVELYDPATGTFSLLTGTLHVGRSRHTVTRIDQRRLLIYGGLTIDGQPAPPEIYDVVAGTSAVLPAAENIARSNHEAITLQDGGILIIGGEDHDQAPIANVLRFDPGSGTFAPYATLATARSATAVNRLLDGRVFIAGGVYGLRSFDITSTTEFLADAAQRRDGPAMNVARRDFTVTRLNSGKLLIVGGLGGNLWPLSSAEIFE